MRPTVAPTRPRRRGPTTDGAVCWGCGHEPDEHRGAMGSCVAYVITHGRESFCLCRAFVPDDRGDAA